LFPVFARVGLRLGAVVAQRVRSGAEALADACGVVGWGHGAPVLWLD